MSAHLTERPGAITNWPAFLCFLAVCVCLDAALIAGVVVLLRGFR